MKLIERLPSNGLRKMLLAIIFSGCANNSLANQTNYIDVPATVPEVAKVAGQAPPLPVLSRCVQIQHVDCSTGDCRLQSGHVPITRSTYESMGFRSYDAYTIPCYADGTVVSSLHARAVPAPFSMIGTFLSTGLVGTHLVRHPQVLTMLNETMFTYLPAGEDISGSWETLANDHLGYDSSEKNSYQFSSLVNISSEAFSNSASREVRMVNTALHEIGHAIYETVLSEEERVAFTDLMIELFDIVQVNDRRKHLLDVHYDNFSNGLAGYLALDRNNQIPATSLPPFRKTAEDVCFTQIAERRGLHIDTSGQTVSPENIGFHKLEAMRLLLLLILSLRERLPEYVELGTGRAGMESFMREEAYAHMFAYGGIFCDLFAPFFQPYLVEQNWIRRQYPDRPNGVQINRNAFLFTTEGRRVLAREFIGFWRYLESRPHVR